MPRIDPNLVLLAGLASSLFMTGLIWFVDVVHYPLFASVGDFSFSRYHDRHSRLTTRVVIGPMVVELATSLMLVVERAGSTTAGWAWAGLVAAIATWVATGLLSVPIHQRLASGFDRDAHRRLVQTNRLRLAAWSLHSLIMLRIVALEMR